MIRLGLRAYGGAKTLATSVFLFLCVPLTAAAGHGPSDELTYRASTEGLTGFNLFMVNLYNDQRMAYAALTTAIMAAGGMAIGISVDFLLARVGLTVSKVEHRE